MSGLSSLLIGIASGIITTIAISLIVTFFYKIVLPWYRSLVYQGLDISGEWKEIIEYPDDNRIIKKETSILKIDQYGYDIKGNVTVTVEPESGKKRTETCKLIGQIFDRFVYLTVRNKNRSIISVGSYLLEVVSGGETMQGCKSWYDVGLNYVVGHKILICRPNYVKKVKMEVVDYIFN